MKKQKIKAGSIRISLKEIYGGERGIRTLETVLRFTRFPVVRPRPD